MAVRTAYDPTAGEVLTATNLEKLAGGWIGHAEVTANQASITTEVDLTSLTVTVTAGPSRRLLIIGRCPAFSSVGSDSVTLAIKESTTYLSSGYVLLSPTASTSAQVFAMAIVTPSTGAHTYKLAMARSQGTGSVTMNAGATQPGTILVEDIGPAA